MKIILLLSFPQKSRVMLIASTDNMEIVKVPQWHDHPPPTRVGVQFAGLILKYLTFGLYLILYSLILDAHYGDYGRVGCAILAIRPLLFIPGIVLHWWGTLFDGAHYDTDLAVLGGFLP